MQILQYLDPTGYDPFGSWFDGLDSQAAAKVTVGVARLEQGNLSNTKSVGSGVLEYRIDFGPGYRLYFGRDGDTIIILLGGGTKQRQQQDITAAHARWADYKRRKNKR
jgi:putative addiction module killer protein